MARLTFPANACGRKGNRSQGKISCRGGENFLATSPRELVRLRSFYIDKASAGCRNKDKASEKLEGRMAAATSASGSPVKGGSKDEKKEKAKRKVMKDANGNEIKRPLSAYMLYNNHRRPTLRSEHPGK
jgi:hypothetical protein